MKIAAWAAFGIGVMLAISGAAKLPAEGSDYPDTMNVFYLGALLAIVGVTLWRMALQKAKQADKKAEADPNATDQQSPASLMAGLMEPLEKLRGDIGELETTAIAERVDELLETYILPLAEIRQRLINSLGMSQGAEILVHVAYGERMLNRVWSAASDGHLPEARACLPEAADALVEANEMLKKAKAAASA